MLYKVLGAGGVCCNGGKGTWSLPTKNDDGTWTPGEWIPAIKGNLVEYENGYHLCRDGQVMELLNDELYEAERRGEMVEADGAVVVREARLLRRFEGWNKRTARLFACDCAERVLPIFERGSCYDMRPRKAIAVARRYANGEASDTELAAVRAAAGDAACEAVCAAAHAAARAASEAARDDVWDAVWAASGAAARAAAKDAARAAAWDAVCDAAWDAEQDWQYSRLCEYLDR